jgi:hypothetical protein
MKKFFITSVAVLVVASLVHAEQPKVVVVKAFTGIYPTSFSLGIPFHGCVVLNAKMPLGEGEHWLSLDHLITDEDFRSFEILVNSTGTILGARAIFKGSLEDWRGARGYASRQRILLPCMGGDGPELSRELPLAYDGNGFGNMVYTFDLSGHVSWRIPQGVTATDEPTYVANQEKHKRECNDAGCKNLHTAATVVLPRKKTSEQDAAPSNGDKPSN